ncbi:MAG TPA: TetR family transcriptional regulator [Streptosporangiaceae bacterium]
MSRRALIADAAISTLARDGMRGLTHRAVDRTAGLPEGSASYYFRTRQALLQATVERLAELDSTDMLASGAVVDSAAMMDSAAMADSAAVPPPPGQELSAFAALAAALVESWLTAGRERQLARYELSLEATRRPELRQTLVTTGAAIRAVIAGRFAAAGVPEPAQRAADFAAFIDGLLFDQIAGAGNRELTAPDLRAAIDTLLAGVTRSR